MSDELFRKMNIAPGSKLPPGGRLGRRGNKNQVDSRLIEKIWRPDIYFDYEKHSTRNFGSANVSRCLSMSHDVTRCQKSLGMFVEPCQRRDNSWKSAARHFTLGPFSNSSF